MIDLEPHHLEMVRKILVDFVPTCEVRAFGSRVKGSARRFSDLDLALVGTQKISLFTLASLEDAFSESDLPIVVDVLDWASASTEFRQLIAAQYEVLQKGVLYGVG